MRWKTVPSKYLFRASATRDAAAWGDVFVSSATTNVPQLVLKVSVHCFAAASGCGFPPSAAPLRGFGAVTSGQPVVVAAFFPPPPQPEAASATAASTTSAAGVLMRVS